MRLELSAEERELQAEVREYLAEHCPRPEDVPHHLDERIAYLREWQARCYASGYVGRSWPAEFGGGGRPPAEQIIVDQELAAAGAPEFPNVVGLDVSGPSLLAFGNDEQRRDHVAKILSAEEIWCQGFSEPEAGSDLASLRTKAVERDDHFLISGQKTWISWGQFASHCGILARTDESDKKHRGISLLIMDMTSPGVEVRPMTQITGHAEFVELFLDEVVVPKENLLGERGQGWAITMYTLGHERGTAALPRQVKVQDLARPSRRRRGRARASRDRRCSRTRRHRSSWPRRMIGIEVLRHHAYRTVGEFLKGGAVGEDSSTVKLLMAEAEQRLAATALDVLGPTMFDGEPSHQAANEFWYETYLYSRAASVYGGSQQIQRGIIADRILKLPVS